jgi:hypothetical protein
VAPPTLTATSRYIPSGTRKIYFVPTISNYLAPTRAELNAGTDLTTEIMEVAGFTVTSNQADVPDMSTRFTSQVPARITADPSTLRIYASQTSNDVRSVLPRDTAGFIVVLWEGDVVGQKMDVFPIKVSSAAEQTGIDDPATILFTFSITKVPATNVTIV